MKKIQILIAASMLVFGLAASLGQTTYAHTKVNKSIPADGATVAAGLSEIELHFAGKMRLTVLKITNSGSGEAVSPKSSLPPKFVSQVNIAVPPLVPGDYNVAWIGVGSDGHVMKGEFKFTVAGKP